MPNKLTDIEKEVEKILKKNITLHSVRQGYGVFNITSFTILAKEISGLFEEWAKEKTRIEIRAVGQTIINADGECVLVLPDDLPPDSIVLFVNKEDAKEAIAKLEKE